MSGQGFGSVGQDDWGGGIFRGRNAPSNSVYDAINCLVNDERELFKRGGGFYKSNTNVATALVGIVDRQTFAGQRTVMWSASEVYALGADDATPTADLSSTFVPAAFVRAVTAAGLLVWPRPVTTNQSVSLALYGGSLKTTYTTGTVNVTNGSKTVTGVGTAWLANVDRGQLFIVGSLAGIVEEVVSNTSLTLREAYPLSTVAGTTYILRPMTSASTTSVDHARVGAGNAYVAAAGSRLLVAYQNYVDFTDPGTATFSASGYHELPSEALVLGAEGVGTSALIFTTAGVWQISNLDLDPVDDAGNVQHQVAQINKDVLLWGDAGMAAWAGGVLVPAVDDIFVMALGGSATPVTAAIRPLYRSYVKAGCKPGIAAVHRGHYFLPVLDGSNTVVDVLVCRLDQNSAWTRWTGHSAVSGYAQRVGATTRQPKLLGINGQRVIELTDCFNVPGAATDADATTPDLTIDTQDYATGGGMRDSYVDRLRLEYEADGTPTPAIAAGWASGSEGATFTTLTVARGGGLSDGSDYSAWPVRKSRDRIRFRISSASAMTKFILRRVEALIRSTGRQ